MESSLFVNQDALCKLLSRLQVELSGSNSIELVLGIHWRNPFNVPRGTLRIEKQEACFRVSLYSTTTSIVHVFNTDACESAELGNAIADSFRLHDRLSYCFRCKSSKRVLNPGEYIIVQSGQPECAQCCLHLLKEEVHNPSSLFRTRVNMFTSFWNVGEEKGYLTKSLSLSNFGNSHGLFFQHFEGPNRYPERYDPESKSFTDYFYSVRFISKIGYVEGRAKTFQDALLDSLKNLDTVMACANCRKLNRIDSLSQKIVSEELDRLCLSCCVAYAFSPKEMCAICHSDIAKALFVSRSTCTHSFCEYCYEMTKKDRCALCRASSAFVSLEEEQEDELTLVEEVD